MGDESLKYGVLGQKIPEFGRNSSATTEKTVSFLTFWHVGDVNVVCERSFGESSWPNQPNRLLKYAA